MLKTRRGPRGLVEWVLLAVALVCAAKPRSHSTPPVFEVFRTTTTGQPIRVAVDGVGLPYIEAWIRTLEDGEEVIDLLLDGRMGIVTREPELARWAWFLANAMAVAGGRTCHGPVSYLRNPHGMSGAGGPQG